MRGACGGSRLLVHRRSRVHTFRRRALEVVGKETGEDAVIHTYTISHLRSIIDDVFRGLNLWLPPQVTLVPFSVPM